MRCLESGYAANVEAVITARPEPQPFDGLPEPVVHDTGETPTISTLVDWANSADLGRDGDRRRHVEERAAEGPFARAGSGSCSRSAIPGDREVDDKRLGAALDPAEYALLGDDDFAKYPFLVKGYIGPKALVENGVRYLVDPRVVDGTSWITGADAPGKHVVGLVAGRDFDPDGTIEAAEVRDGDLSPDGAGPLVSARGIEIGHIFQLGRKYTDAFSVDVLGEDGKPVRLTMGSYGIGVSRLVAVIAEQQHDEIGLRWPSSVSPFDVHLVIANKDAAARDGATELAGDLASLGVDVLTRRPASVARREVQGRRAIGCAVDRRGRPWLGRRSRGVAQPIRRRGARGSGRRRRNGDRGGYLRVRLIRCRRETAPSTATRSALGASVPRAPRTRSKPSRRRPGPGWISPVPAPHARPPRRRFPS